MILMTMFCAETTPEQQQCIQQCDRTISPACGDDGVTYPNSCVADCLDVKTTDGPCEGAGGGPDGGSPAPGGMPTGGSPAPGGPGRTTSPGGAPPAGGMPTGGTPAGGAPSGAPRAFSGSVVAHEPPILSWTRFNDVCEDLESGHLSYWQCYTPASTTWLVAALATPV